MAEATKKLVWVAIGEEVSAFATFTGKTRWRDTKEVVDNTPLDGNIYGRVEEALYEVPVGANDG